MKRVRDIALFNFHASGSGKIPSAHSRVSDPDVRTLHGGLAAHPGYE
jgi:hypothetical protein